MPPRSKDELKIRLDCELKRAFMRACSKRDETASQAVRRFVREYVSENPHVTQRGLFEPSAPASPSPQST